MAQFLQETVGEVALSGTSKVDAAKEFNEFFNQCRNSGVPAPTADIVRVARKFQDELTLTNLSRPQLVSLARFMNLNAFGTDAFLRKNIENQLKDLKADDELIVSDSIARKISKGIESSDILNAVTTGADALGLPTPQKNVRLDVDPQTIANGVNEMTLSELANACSARGIVTHGVSPARMRSELQQWLELHLIHKIPSSLLLLSHAFQTTSRILQPGDDTLGSKAEALQATLSSLPHQVFLAKLGCQ